MTHLSHLHKFRSQYAHFAMASLPHKSHTAVFDVFIIVSSSTQTSAAALRVKLWEMQPEIFQHRLKTTVAQCDMIMTSFPRIGERSQDPPF
jgi:hypothetical protein